MDKIEYNDVTNPPMQIKSLIEPFLRGIILWI